MSTPGSHYILWPEVGQSLFLFFSFFLFQKTRGGNVYLDVSVVVSYIFKVYIVWEFPVLTHCKAFFSKLGLEHQRAFRGVAVALQSAKRIRGKRKRKERKRDDCQTFEKPLWQLFSFFFTKPTPPPFFKLYVYIYMLVSLVSRATRLKIPAPPSQKTRHARILRKKPIWP